MIKNYDYLVNRVKSRTNPDSINESLIMDKEFSTEIRNLSDKKVLEYIKRSMRGVEPRYTELTIEAGNKVREHLKSNNPNLDYKYQGSVMCNTHIYGHSDIDLVQISNEFYTHEPKSEFTKAYTNVYLTQSQKARLLEIIDGNIYAGIPLDTLRKIRLDAENVLSNTYKYVNVNKGKSIEVEPTNPKRTIDVVTASWYVNVDSVLENETAKKGIQIYDKIKNLRIPVDYPFLKIELLNKKDKAVNGRLKKMIRFSKNVKADSNKEMKALSSFDISSICYNIDEKTYQDLSYFELVFVLFSEVKRIIEDDNYRDSIMSIDKTEYIFKDEPKKLIALIDLYKELKSLNEDMLKSTPILKFL